MPSPLMFDSWRPPWVRFMGFVREAGNGCLEWTGETNSEGYGRFDLVTLTRPNRRVRVLAHRYAYELAVGEIPAGLVIDHLCRNRRCVNPDHLEPVDQATNIRRGTAPAANRARFAAITHCPKGHPYDEANTRIKLGADGYRYRVCRECSRIYTRAYLARKRQEAAA